MTNRAVKKPKKRRDKRLYDRAEELHNEACQMQPSVQRSKLIGMSMGVGRDDPLALARAIFAEPRRARREALVKGYNDGRAT